MRGTDAMPAATRPSEGDTRTFLRLVRDVAACRACPAMVGRTRVLTGENGPLSARVLFVAEAPGRLGADRSGIPLQGDRTGDNFETLLAVTGWVREDVFISNAVLCNPRDDGGRNRPPNRDEVANCASHLERLIEVLDPAFVVTLGAVALKAAGTLERHTAVLAADVGRPMTWFGRVLIPLYHPGPRALIHRPLARQRRDYRRLRAVVGAMA